MTDQPEALRLADALEMTSNHGIRRGAAAELRRLHAELRRLQIDSDALGVHLSERMKDLFKVEAQRDALLEALLLIQIECQHLHHAKKDQHALGQPCPVVARISAAIVRAAAEIGRNT